MAKEQIHLNEESLRNMIREALAEIMPEEFGDTSMSEEWHNEYGNSHGTGYSSGAYTSSSLYTQCDSDDQYRRMELAKRDAERRKKFGLDEAINNAIKKIIG